MGRNATRLLWQHAAETLLADDQGDGSSTAQAATKLVHQHAEALRQYLAVRSGSEEAARPGLAYVREQVQHWSAERLLSPPGPRAHLFALARAWLNRSDTLMGAAVTEDSGQRLRWQLDASDARPSATALRQLEAAQAEVLELRHAHNMDSDELAHVLELTPDMVKTRVEQAEATAATIVGDGDVGSAAAAAFALERDEEAAHAAVEPNSAPLPRGTVIDERYALEQRVGIGAFGQVYRARDTAVPGHTVAVKILHAPSTDAESKLAALRELRLIAAVFHPSVVSFKDHGWYQDRLWFVMPWYEGEPLETRLMREPLTRKEALHIFVPLANALATMHAQEVRHQDIKPENIFLTRLETEALSDDALHPVLIDLGVAAKESELLVAGTPTYFAPEVAAQYAQMQDAPLVTSKADIFSLALSLQNALEPSSQEDVSAETLFEFVLHRAANQPPEVQGEDLRFLRPHFKRWLAVNAEDRPTAEQFVQELQVLVEPEVQRERRRAFMRWFLPLAASFVVVFGVAAFELSREADRQRTEAELARREAEAVRSDLETEAARSKRLAQGAEQLQAQIAETDEHRRNLQGELESEQERASRLSGNVNWLRKQRSALRDDVKEVKATLGETEDELRATSSKLGDTRTALQRSQSTLQQAEATLEQTQQALTRSESLLGTTQGALRKSQGETRTVRDELGRSQRTAAQRKRELDRTEQDLANARATLGRTQATLRDVRRNLDDAQRQQRVTARQRDEQQAAARQQRSRANGLQAEVRQLQQRVEALERQLRRQNGRPSRRAPSTPGQGAGE